MNFGQFIEELMIVLPYWHYKIDRPFKQSHSERGDNMSLETYYCLQMLRREGAMTMTELSRSLKITKQQATRMIDRLYQYDFVRRETNEKDRRSIRIAATDVAVEYIEKNIYQEAAFLNETERRLSAEEFEELGQAVRTLLRILPKLD